MNIKNFFINDSVITFSVESEIILNIKILNFDGNEIYKTEFKCEPHKEYFISHPFISKKNNFLLVINNITHLIKRNLNTIEQVSFGKTISFFENGLKDRWGLSDYYDINSPCLFFGVLGNEDKINNHKSFCLIFPVDVTCEWNIHKINNKKNIIIIDRPHINISKDFKKIKGEFEIKDYSIFKPNIMGDKIYAYIGQKERKEEFKYSLIKEIQKNIDFEIIIGEQKNPKNYLDINITKNLFYDKSFLNLNFSKVSGLTTVIEMGLMGRKTITNNFSKWDCMIPYNNFDDIVSIIKKESKKIGTVQENINIHTINEVWKNIKYWKNFI
jgi:hypothetical protein